MTGRTTINAQQQTRIQQNVLSARNVPRFSATNINFRVNPGVVVPSRINFVSVAAFPVLIDTFPDFRDDSFFVVDDEIVFVDRDRRVVDVVPAGPRTHFSRRGFGSGSVAAVNLPPEEIREVQQVLIDRGLLTGEADGVFGTRTREALITFQRQQGFETTGSIDTRTVAALGLSNKIQSQSSTSEGQSSTMGQGMNQGQSSTVGQGGQTNAQEPAPQKTTGQGTGQGQANAPTQNQAPQNQTTTGQAPQNQSTTGQSQGSAQPPVQQNTTGQAPSGQGNVQAPAQKSNQR
jgi:hypothetical protein